MDLHSRYLQQASWTGELRAYLLDAAAFERAEAVLEVGCGTGAILSDLTQRAGRVAAGRPRIHGLDIRRASLHMARSFAPGVILTQGDAHRLPLADRSFDITCCHFLLLWLSDPLVAIREMRRVTKPSGHVLAFAEPDYAARQDYPREFARVGALQTRALAAQGADTGIGSRIADLFDAADLRVIETGAIAPQELQAIGEQQWASEWVTLREDISGMLSDAELDHLQQMDKQARRLGQRRLYVPTYFVHAQV